MIKGHFFRVDVKDDVLAGSSAGSERARVEFDDIQVGDVIDKYDPTDLRWQGRHHVLSALLDDTLRGFNTKPVYVNGTPAYPLENAESLLRDKFSYKLKQDTIGDQINDGNEPGNITC